MTSAELHRVPQPGTQSVIASAGRRLEEFAAERGVALAPLAQSVGVDAADLKHPDRRVGLEAFMRLLHLLETVTGDDCLGLRYALAYQQGDSGAFGLAILHAPTLREALRIYQSYQRLVADNAFFEITEAGEEVTIRWRHARLSDYPDQYTDFRAGLLVKMLRNFIRPDWYPRRVELLRTRPRDPGMHRAHFGPGLSFRTSAVNALAITIEDYDTVHRDSDLRLFEVLEQSCRTALATLDRSRDLRLQVSEQVLALLPSGEATLSRVAANMGLGERSLQRRLAELETSFDRLLEETRRDLSDRLLATTTPLAEISYLCGYSSASAYSRAARNWYGISPIEVRQQMRAATD